MNILALIILFMVAFALQYFSTFLQMRGFTKAYKACRKDGFRAVIGKFSGAFHAGSIIMFGIDNDGIIHNGTVMQGVTVFARFKDFNKFNQHSIDELSDLLEKTSGLSYSIRKAIEDADLNYKTIMRGEEVPVPPSPIKKAGNLLVKSGKQLTQVLNRSSL